MDAALYISERISGREASRNPAKISPENDFGCHPGNFFWENTVMLLLIAIGVVTRVSTYRAGKTATKL
jgi:hypothetical protein